MKPMDNFDLTMDLGFAPESLFETDQHVYGDGPITADLPTSKTGTFSTSSFEDFMDFDLDLSSESMSSFLEMEQIPEVKSEPQKTRPSVIIRKQTSNKKMEAQPILSTIMTDCGIFKEFTEDFNDVNDTNASIASPSSIHSEMEQNQELIDELEEFFIKVDGKPTVVDETSEPVSLPATNSSDEILSALTTGNVVENNNTLTMEDLNNAYTTSLVSEDGQNVIIIIAPSSPAEFDSFLEPVSPNEFKDPLNSQTATNDSDSSYDTDPDWSPSPASDTSFDTKLLSPPQQTKHRKKYARSRPPQPPSGPYPVEKKERKKAQNRTAAFRYREKKKSEQDMIDEELELLSTKNNVLKDKLTEMETEFKYLKKLMTEAGLGRYAQTVKI